MVKKKSRKFQVILSFAYLCLFFFYNYNSSHHFDNQTKKKTRLRFYGAELTSKAQKPGQRGREEARREWFVWKCRCCVCCPKIKAAAIHHGSTGDMKNTIKKPAGFWGPTAGCCILIISLKWVLLVRAPTLSVMGWLFLGTEAERVGVGGMKAANTSGQLRLCTSLCCFN